MSNVRNWYIYLTNAISLNAVLWAVITFLRALIDFGIRSDLEVMAFQVAIIVIGLPLFVVHWFWAQRLASKDEKEQRSPIRRLYVYSVLAGTLGPFLASTFTLFVGLIDSFRWLSVARYFVTVIPLAAVFAYHQWVLSKDVDGHSPTGDNATTRRIYIYGFSATGLWMTTAALINLLHWIFLQLNPNTIASTGTLGDISKEIVRLSLGLAVWAYFSRWGQRLFESSSAGEQASVLRKLYLYLVVFITVITIVSTATALLAGIFRRLLGLPPSGSLPLAMAYILGMGAVWIYHAYLLRRDAAAAPDAPSQLGVRRLYLYLVAAIGLAAFLIGVVGNLNLLIDAISSTTVIGTSQKEEFAWFTAAILSGLAVWVFPWRVIWASTVGDDPQSADNRNSLARRIYLYFYLFVAVMAMLGSLIYIVFQFLLLLLGERTFTLLLNDLAQALSYTFIGLAVLLYHSFILRADGRVARRHQAEQLEKLDIHILDGDEGEFGLALQKAIAAEFPDADLTMAGMTKAASEAFGQELSEKALTVKLAEAKLIVAPWYIAVNDGNSSALREATITSPARKLLVPLARTGWDWAAFPPMDFERAARETTKAVEQIVKGEEVKATRGLGCGGIVVIMFGGFILLNVVGIVLALLLSF